MSYIWRVIPDPVLRSTGFLHGRNNAVFPVSLGRSGIIKADQKCEGDGATPDGCYRIEKFYYRPDRVEIPLTSLTALPLEVDMGWCDDTDYDDYNHLIRRPFSGSHEALWRDDNAYDLLLTLDHNTSPVIKGKGSAIFIHQRHLSGRATEGCVALYPSNMVQLIKALRIGDSIAIDTGKI